MYMQQLLFHSVSLLFVILVKIKVALEEVIYTTCLYNTKCLGSFQLPSPPPLSVSSSTFPLPLPSEWIPGSSQGYPQHEIHQHPFVHLVGECTCESEVSCPRTNSPQIGLKLRLLDPEERRPLCLNIPYKDLWNESKCSPGYFRDFSFSEWCVV